MKNNNLLRKIIIAGIIPLLLFGASKVLAHQPSVIGWQIVEAAQNGGAVAGPTVGGDDEVLVELFANSPFDKEMILLVAFDSCGEDPKTVDRPILNLEEIISGKESSPRYPRVWETPGCRWRVCPDQDVLLLQPGDKARLALIVDFLRLADEGMSPRLRGQVYEVDRSLLQLTKEPRELLLLVEKQQPVHSLILDLFYRLKGREWLAGDYADIFGAPSKGRFFGPKTADYDRMIAEMPVNLLAFRRYLRLPGKFRDDGGRWFELTLDRIRKQMSGKAGDKVCDQEDIAALRHGDLFAEEDEEEEFQAPQAVTHIITGMFSTRWSSDHALHPGFGFKVEAWTNETGSWKRLAAGWVQSNGTWELRVDSSKAYSGSQLRVMYRSYNSYYEPQNQDGHSYSWRDPDRFNIPSNFYVGHRYADTDGGTYNGVGELVEAAMYMWSRLYWNGGINPVPGTPIVLYFPNTWYDCGDGSGVPWSCANTSGEIWLTSAHGIQADVVVHELSHQLNNKFWNNKRPAGSGGSHSLNGCYPTRLGMALREGFANFMPAWVGYPSRNVAEGGFSAGRWALGYDPETRFPPPNCANGWENEVWVARTFWDLHDTRSDGNDILWFIHRGAVISLYLANGVANDGDARDMRDYENIYRNAATPGHEGFISDIFDQNRM
jgi:hypothetical protein